ncbi:Hsp20 family protein [Sphingomonas histidinilytica]|nr:Hsp20 family protein [Rhizorhabdus histidinilytica]
MWSEAIAMLERVERLHRQSFEPESSKTLPCWEPPVDVLETDREILILVALPGVDPEQVAVTIEKGTLLVIGQRVLPPELRTAVIHRLELPQGRFERRLPLPAGRYDAVRKLGVNGCLLVGLRKVSDIGSRP